MQNINVKDVVSKGLLHCGWSPKVLQGYVALQDVAAAAKVVILNPELHNRARYELVGENITLEDVAKTIGRVSGKAIPAEQVPREQVASRALVPAKAQGAYAKDGLDRMLYYYDKRYVVMTASPLAMSSHACS